MKGEKTDDGELGQPKLPEARSIRELSRVLEDPKGLAVFRSSDGDLPRALARVEADHQIEFAPTVLMCETILGSLSPDRLRRMTASDIGTLKALRTRIDQLLEDRARLGGGASGQVQP